MRDVIAAERLPKAPLQRVMDLPREHLDSWAAAEKPTRRSAPVRRQIDDFAAISAETGAVAYVVSEHRSRSIVLPVVLFNFGGGMAGAIVRDNFYDYKVTVVAGDPVDLGPLEADGQEAVSACYCEGFPSDLVLGRHRDDRSAFTLEIRGAEMLRRVLGALAQHVGSGPHRRRD